jgi:hypothetical protein
LKWVPSKIAYSLSELFPVTMFLVLSSRYPVPGGMKTPYAFWPPTVVGAAVALARLSGPPAAPPPGASVRLLPLAVWS